MPSMNPFFKCILKDAEINEYLHDVSRRLHTAGIVCNDNNNIVAKHNLSINPMTYFNNKAVPELYHIPVDVILKEYDTAAEIGDKLFKAAFNRELAKYDYKVREDIEFNIMVTRINAVLTNDAWGYITDLYYRKYWIKNLLRKLQVYKGTTNFQVLINGYYFENWCIKRVMSSILHFWTRWACIEDPAAYIIRRTDSLDNKSIIKIVEDVDALEDTDIRDAVKYIIAYRTAVAASSAKYVSTVGSESPEMLIKAFNMSAMASCLCTPQRGFLERPLLELLWENLDAQVLFLSAISNSKVRENLQNIRMESLRANNNVFHCSGIDIDTDILYNFIAFDNRFEALFSMINGNFNKLLAIRNSINETNDAFKFKEKEFAFKNKFISLDNIINNEEIKLFFFRYVYNPIDTGMLKITEYHTRIGDNAVPECVFVLNVDSLSGSELPAYMVCTYYGMYGFLIPASKKTLDAMNKIYGISKNKDDLMVVSKDVHGIMNPENLDFPILITEFIQEERNLSFRCATYAGTVSIRDFIVGTTKFAPIEECAPEDEFHLILLNKRLCTYNR